ncbi:MAG TPA: hypothetical protein VND91_04600 [Candidatus Saccharimonadia bacterium]|nr:hypothetical protein [Candidatus Saccharimonadia bacterium]
MMLTRFHAGVRLALLVATTVLPTVVSAQTFPANDNSLGPTLTADGQKLAFFSTASNLVRGDTNGLEDVFVLDRSTNQMTRVSVNSAGQESDGQSYGAAIDSTGGFVVFASNASNLVLGDTNRTHDVFRKNLTDGSIVRVNVDAAGAQVAATGLVRFPRVSPGGRFVSWHACMPGLVPGLAVNCRMFLKDTLTGGVFAPGGSTVGATTGSVASRVVLIQLTRATRASLAFTTTESLVAADTNSAQDVYLGTLTFSGGTPQFVYTLVSRNSAGTNGGNGASGSPSGESAMPPGISGNGERIAYFSPATDIVAANPCNLVGRKAFVYDVSEGTNSCESGVIPTGVPVNLAPDGNHIVYHSGGSGGAWNLEAVRDGSIAPIGIGTGRQGGSRLEITGRGAVSDGATVAAFVNDFTDPVNLRNDTRDRVLVYNAGSPTLTVASNGRIGTEEDGHSRVASISANGGFVAFSSYASGYDATDPGADRDVFLRNLASGALTRISALLATPKADARWPDVSSDGSKVVFLASATQCAGGLGEVWLWTAPGTISCLDDVNPSGSSSLVGSEYQQPSISDDGSTVAFAAEPASGVETLYRKTLPAGIPVAVAPYIAFEALTFQLSGTGRYLVYGDTSGAGSSGAEGCFPNFAVKRYDALGQPQVISKFNTTNTPASGSWASISPDGAYVAFVSCDNLANESFPPAGTKVFLWSARTNTVTRLGGSFFGRTAATVKARTRVSNQGLYVAYIADNICINRCGTRNRSVMLYDSVTRGLRTVSATPAFNRANGPSGVFDDLGFDTELYSLDIDATARKVVFGSAATNLVPRDFNAADDVFVVDTPSQAIARVSAFGSGLAGDRDRVGPSLSGNGAVIAYGLRDRDGAIASTGAIVARDGEVLAKGLGSKWGDIAVNNPVSGGELVITTAPGGGAANGDSGEPDVSGDGTVVVFSSNASNLTAAPDNNNVTDVVIYEMQTATNTAVSASGNGPSADPAVTTNALGDKWVAAFSTDATNLQTTGVTSDTNGDSDVVVATEGVGTELVSRADGAAGVIGNGPSGEATVLSGGTMVAFSTLATNLKPAVSDTNAASDVVLRDLVADVNIVLSDPDGAGPLEADGPSSDPTIAKPSFSADPWIAAFESDATNLRGLDTDSNANTDIYLRLPSGEIRLVSHRVGDVTMTASGTSTSPELSPDGLNLVFISNADDLIANDGNGLPDLFVYNVVTQSIARISQGAAQLDSNDLALAGDIATDANGNAVAVFDSAATNLTPIPDTEEAFDVYYTDGNGNIVPVGPADLMFRSGFENIQIQP